MAVPNLKEIYEVETRNSAFYAGGRIRWTSDGQTIFCSVPESINMVNIEEGCVKKTFSSEEDSVLCFTIDKKGNQIISCHRSNLFKLWSTEEGTVLKRWKTIHKGPVAEMELSENGNILVTGGCDSVIRIWNLDHQVCVLALRGIQGVISALKIIENELQQRVLGVGDDYVIHLWDLKSGNLINKYSGHYSKVTAFVVTEKYLVSCGRDKVIIAWDLITGETLKTLPIYESLEGLVKLPKKFELAEKRQLPSGDYVACVGEKGVIRVLELPSGQELFCQSESVITKNKEDSALTATQLLFNPSTNLLAVTTFDHNIIFYHLDTFKCQKQLIGYSDEILDLALIGPKESHVVVATNSSDLKLYNLQNQNCQLLKGHSDFVLSLAASFSNPHLLLSSGKVSASATVSRLTREKLVSLKCKSLSLLKHYIQDLSVRLWEFNSKTETMTCIAVGCRHTGAVSALSFAQLSDEVFCSAGNDMTLKLWNRKDHTITVHYTEVAHNKDINSICFSPNDRIVATASQDKTAKLWNSADLSLLGVLSGHRRGIWCVKFSPIDQIVLTSSADCSIKLWSIMDLACLKTFEGHESSVLRAFFLSRGMQIISASGNGLLKLWTIKTSECVGTFDGHSDKIWAMDVSKSEARIITGGADSLLLIWKDMTEAKKLEKMKAREEQLEKEQTLKNLIHHDKLLAALALALDLDRPLQVLTIIKDLMKRGKSEGLEETVSKLSVEHKEKLLKCASSWNLNAKHCACAQKVISILLDDIAVNKLMINGLSTYVEELLPYTERHFQRLSNVLQDLHLIQYSCELMKPTLSNR